MTEHRKPKTPSKANAKTRTSSANSTGASDTAKRIAAMDPSVFGSPTLGHGTLDALKLDGWRASLTEEQLDVIKRWQQQLDAARKDPSISGSLKAIGDLAASSNSRFQTEVREWNPYPQRPTEGDKLVQRQIKSLESVMVYNGEQAQITAATVGKLVEVTEQAKRNADRTAKVTIFANIVLVLLTMVLIYMTAVLIGNDNVSLPEPTVAASPAVSPK